MQVSSYSPSWASILRRNKKRGTDGTPFFSNADAELRACFRRNATIWQFFFDTSRFARTLTQVVQLGAANITTAFHFDRSDQRRVQLERTLNAFARRDLTNDEVRVQAAVTTGDNDAFVCLGALAGALDYVDVDDNGIARCEIRNGFTQAGNFFLL